MSRKEKLLKRIKGRPRDFTWDELTSLLKSLGYEQAKPGTTGGSRRRFVHETYPTITLHKPHPSNVLKMYQISQIIELLENEGLL